MKFPLISLHLHESTSKDVNLIAPSTADLRRLRYMKSNTGELGYESYPVSIIALIKGKGMARILNNSIRNGRLWIR